ncbi:MAG: hypothetical protein JST54_06725 [Deltaproteobacteria bacterium]|nr:hypothetical protein [Deltaproteobacteria bacterium]
MPTWLKVTLGVVAAGIALFLLLIGGIFLYVRSHKDELISAGKEAMSAGAAYGTNQTAQGCIDEGLHRLTGISSFGDEVKNNLWATGCLQAAAPTPGFCNDVPLEGEILKTASWRLAQCNAHAGVDPQRCQRFLQVWQKACHPSPEGPGSPLQR